MEGTTDRSQLKECLLHDKKVGLIDLRWAFEDLLWLISFFQNYMYISNLQLITSNKLFAYPTYR